MSSALADTREELRVLLKEYSKKVVEEKSEEESWRDEAKYAATGLKSEDIMDRVRAVEFLEILGDNPFAQDHLLVAIKDKEPSVYNKAINALGRVADTRSIPGLQELSKSTNSKHLAAEVARIVGKIERNSDNAGQ
jgi:HEAT repeat protein